MTFEGDENKAEDPDDFASSLLERSSLLLSFLASQPHGNNEAATMRMYIQLCPLLLPDSPVARAALRGLEDYASSDGSEDSIGIHGSLKIRPYPRFVRLSLHSQKEPEFVRESTQTLPITDKQNHRRRVAGLTARTLLLDLPLLLIFLVHACLEWINYVHVNYLSKQLKAVEFTDSRRENEITYYARPCQAGDLTTNSSTDLYLAKDATPEEAFEHHLLHGFTVFQGVLSQASANELRQYVVDKNRDLKPDEAFGVLEQDHRFSFGLDAGDEVVAKSMMEIASHPQLRPALEKIIGTDPAILELSTITSSYGAANQGYHPDVSAHASAMRFARSFAPSYSLFVPLQNTTAQMGATGVCPGSHYCYDLDAPALWEKLGFQVVDPERGYWAAGDAVLMTQDSYHRGSAHTDPHAPDRVLLVVTFTPKPRERVETRLMSHGNAFSIRWDAWGHTLNDLASADSMMKRPWTILRALGLYKPKGAAWGLDYVTSSSMRMVNVDYGFRSDHFSTFIDKGGIPLIPRFLQGRVTNDEDPWYEYFQDTLRLCSEFWKQVRQYATTAYVVTFVGIGVWQGSTSQISILGHAAIRLCILWLLAAGFYRVLQTSVDSSNWSKDIVGDHHYAKVFENQSAFGIETPGRSTFPTLDDVLFETRYSPDLGLYGSFLQGHPGNRLFREFVKGTASQFHHYPSFLKNATSHYILSEIQSLGGRILYQGAEGKWHWQDDESAASHISRELLSQSSRSTSLILEKSRQVTSNYMHGLHRRTVMAQKYAVPYQRQLESKVLGIALHNEPALKVKSHPEVIATTFQRKCLRKFSIHQLSTRSIRSPFPPLVLPSEPNDGDWIAEGDVVELYDVGYWHYGTVKSVLAHGEYTVSYCAGEKQYSGLPGSVRRFEEFQVGEEVQFTDDFDEYHPCTIRHMNVDGTLDVYISFFDEIVTSVPPCKIRRFADEEEEQEDEDDELEDEQGEEYIEEDED